MTITRGQFMFKFLKIEKKNTFKTRPTASKNKNNDFGCD